MKTLLGLLLTLACAAPAQAQVKAGSHVLSLQAGTALPLTRYGDPDVFVGNQGASFGGRYLYQWRPAWSLGVDILYDAFKEKPLDSGIYRLTTNPKLFQALVIGKRTFLPDWKWRPYAWGGLGLGVFSLRKTEIPQPGMARLDGSTDTRTLVDGSSRGLAFALATGFDWDLTKRLTAGFELRWNQTAIDKSRFFGDKFHSFNIGALLGYRLGGR
ncbi:MAG: outer membrane beta-barrel protein [Elusimicrobia bacterium]|nr:outer membrane beta-barrel protein [Elusimicrobiota bacterium]